MSRKKLFITAKEISKRWEELGLKKINPKSINNWQYQENSNFPKPRKFPGGAFYRISEIEEWEKKIGMDIMYPKNKDDGE